MTDTGEKTDNAASPLAAIVDRVKAMPTRRKLVLGGGTAAVAVASVLAATSSGQTAFAMAASRTTKKGAEDLGGGFYLVDGWVLTEADLKAMGRS
ncbi:MAG: hypothetical protein AAGH41_01650 [Pseudomonadota bacterium]